jgi:hypothetical protein
MSDYEQYCEAYALYGNPERDHWEYEEAATFDRWDGWIWNTLEYDEYDEPNTPDDEWLSVLWLEENAESNLDYLRAVTAFPVPF